MSFTSNSNQQLTFDESYNNLTDSEKNFLLNLGLNLLLKNSFILLKKLLNMTDDEMVETLMFDIRFQYLLHTTSFKEQVHNDRSIGIFGERCNTY